MGYRVRFNTPLLEYRRSSKQDFLSLMFPSFPFDSPQHLMYFFTVMIDCDKSLILFSMLVAAGSPDQDSGGVTGLGSNSFQYVAVAFCDTEYKQKIYCV